MIKYILCVLLALTYAPTAHSFDVFGLFSTEQLTNQFKQFGAATTGETTQVAKFYDYFEPRKELFNAPQCLRNLADIIEEFQQLSQPTDFSVNLEKIVKSSTRYAEMLLSCGFALQFQKAFQVFIAVKTKVCSSPSVSSCGQQMIEDLSSEDSLFKKLLPCATKVREQYILFKQNEKSGLNIQEFKIFLEGALLNEECSFIDASAILNSWLPCLATLEKFLSVILEMFKNVSMLFTMGPSITNVPYEHFTTCQVPISSFIFEN